MRPRSGSAATRARPGPPAIEAGYRPPRPACPRMLCNSFRTTERYCSLERSLALISRILGLEATFAVNLRVTCLATPSGPTSSSPNFDTEAVYLAVRRGRDRSDVVSGRELVGRGTHHDHNGIVRRTLPGAAGMREGELALVHLGLRRSSHTIPRLTTCHSPGSRYDPPLGSR